MKYLKNFEKDSKIICDKCNWSWVLEDDDDNKYLCHKCGYDNKLEEFDIKSLNKWKNENPNLPFNELKVSENIFIREFKQESESGHFTWHRDREDRIIESIGETDWMFQMDNELPMLIENKIFIPKGIYHRLIKGNGDLLIKVNKKPA